MINLSDIIPYGFRRRKKGMMMNINDNPLPEWEYSIPEDFVMIVDTREQAGLFLPKPLKNLCVMRATLKYGDYSIKGFEDQIAVERKNIDDLWSSVTKDKQRFGAELTGLKQYERKWILIEGVESQYLCFRPERQIHPNSVRQALASIEAKMGIPIHSCESKALAERWVLDLFLAYFKMKRKGDDNGN